MSAPVPSPADANPVLAQFVRGGLAENIYRGALCVSDAEGNVLASAGDIERMVFPRSAIKSMQALAIFRSGADRAFGFGNAAIALACSSHNGEAAHTDLAATMLAAAGFDESDLVCGAHPPIDSATRRAMLERGEKPTALHNPCSGKHAGMLSVARALGIDAGGYGEAAHPVQRQVRRAIEDVLGTGLREDRCGMDGCSIPTWAAPLRAFATGFARMATGHGLDEKTAQAAKTIFDSAASHPFLLGGTASFDSEIMDAFAGRLMIKFGADGVFCGALRDRGLGFALKCDDGSVAAATAMIAGFLLACADPDEGQRALLERHARKRSRNWAGNEVGWMEATEAVRLAL